MKRRSLLKTALQKAIPRVASLPKRIPALWAMLLGMASASVLFGQTPQASDVEIETCDGVTCQDVPAGISSVTAPLPSAGSPVFRLTRAGSTVIEFSSVYEVVASHPQHDVVYRAGGSIRALEGGSRPAAQQCSEGPAAAEDARGEPVWLAR